MFLYHVGNHFPLTVKSHFSVKQLQVTVMSFTFVLANMTVLKSSPGYGWACVFCFIGKRLLLKSRKPPFLLQPATWEWLFLLPGESWAHGVVSSSWLWDGGWRTGLCHTGCNWGSVWVVCSCIHCHSDLALCSQQVQKAGFGHGLSGGNKLNSCNLYTVVSWFVPST